MESAASALKSHHSRGHQQLLIDVTSPASPPSTRHQLTSLAEGDIDRSGLRIRRL